MSGRRLSSPITRLLLRDPRYRHGLRPQPFIHGRTLILALAAAGLGLLGWAQIRPPSPWLIWNASSSMPVGFYRADGRTDLARGDLVLAHLPPAMAALATERGYLPAHMPVIKRLAGLPGDLACMLFDQVLIVTRPAGITAPDPASPGMALVQTYLRVADDRQGRALPHWSQCRVLGLDEVLLIGSGSAQSFDSRYFGPLPAALILTRLKPLWTS